MSQFRRVLVEDWSGTIAIISFFIFFITFIVISIRAIRLDKQKTEHLSTLPLDHPNSNQKLP